MTQSASVQLVEQVAGSFKNFHPNKFPNAKMLPLIAGDGLASEMLATVIFQVGVKQIVGVKEWEFQEAADFSCQCCIVQTLHQLPNPDCDCIILAKECFLLGAVRKLLKCKTSPLPFSSFALLSQS